MTIRKRVLAQLEYDLKRGIRAARDRDHIERDMDLAEYLSGYLARWCSLRYLVEAHEAALDEAEKELHEAV